ncbi:hypothetical protein SETIT_J001800v2 [Setaria italica]|uniref:NB-ARC domain-containing protein n=2 Tax=Setaria italica TaxID=4555 RepID=A0A368PEJ8_SETIT|nr:uncharacterized protein LOC101785941 [Setaria italica]RCU61436.1 hypothetical protein SETIT_J001800v2 [Setaria italica]
MADQVESKQPAPGGETEQLKQLHSRVEKLCDDIDKEVDSDLPGRDNLARISDVLKVIKDKITPTEDGGDVSAATKEQQLLPLSKREELFNLLPSIERALAFQQQQRKQAPGEQGQGDKTRLPSATGCNPFKPRSSQRQSEQQRREEEEDEVVSLKLLLRLTQNVLEPEQYYEWTTSYVDESRIYGWDKEANELAEALVAPDDGESLFRAAGIAGVHGSGKTALAQKVFVHDKAKDNFAIRLWVCVGPPDSEDRFGLLYRMLDNLGLDTAKVEVIVDNSNAVKPHRDDAVARIRSDTAKVASIKEAAEKVRRARQAQEQTDKQKPDDGDVKDDTKEGQAADDSIFNQLLKEAADESPDVQKSKIGVLLYILHTTLSKTSYMIVFDDIRAYGDDGWYSNLALAPPPEGEWGDRLGYGLPKGNHRGAVLLTCRNEDHARSMVRTGRVVRPPRLELDDAWKLFRREYDQAKEAKRSSNKGGDDDKLLKDLEQMQKEIVNKCLGLPVAIAEAAKGFADLEPLPDAPPPKAEANKPAVVDQTGIGSNKDMQPAAGGGESKDAADDGESQD